MSRLKSMRWLLLISGVLLVVLGICTLFMPTGGLVSLAVFISVVMLVSGVSEIISYFGEDDRSRSGWVLAGGILTTLLGLWLLIGRGFSALAALIPYVFAVWVLCSGIMRVVGSFSLKSAHSDNWGWVLALGILEAALGFVLMFYPILSAVLTSVLIAALFIGHGISDIMMFSGITRLRSELKRLFGNHKAE